MRARKPKVRVVRNEARGTWNGIFPGGSRKLGLLSAMAREEAQRQAKDLERDFRLRAERSTPTVKQVVERFAAEKMPKRFSTRYGYECWIRNHILPAWGEKLFTELKARPVDLWLQSLALSPKSRVHIRGVISRLWKYAMYAEIVPHESNPMDLVEISGASKPKRKPHTLTVEEFRLFLEKLEEPFRTIALMCISLGLRISEALALQWADVDWLESTIQIARGIVRNRVDSTKTDESERKLALDREVLSILGVWRQRTEFPAEGDWVFASPTQLGRLPWSYPCVWRKVSEAARDAGIGKLSPHDLRHSYRAWLDDSGAPPTMQQLLMRHADIRTTMEYGKRRRVPAEMREANSKVVRLALN